MPYEDFMDKRLFIPLGMKDTTFWPNEEQLKRLAKAYRPTKDKKDLEEIKISQLKYPLNDRKRQPMPAGGLFSTAHDMGVFCQMVLNKGEFKGKRYLSEEAVEADDYPPNRRQGEAGLGPGLFDRRRQFRPRRRPGHQHEHRPQEGHDHRLAGAAAGFPGNGGQSQAAFRKAADEVFKNSRK